MRNAFLAGVSAIALTLGGCSTFHSMFGTSDNSSSNAATPAPQAQAQTQAPSANTPSSNASVFNPGQSAQPNQAATSGSSMTPSSGSTKSASTGMHHMRSSMNAGEVKQAQQKLKDDGEYQGQIDGKFGPQTAQAVKQYQGKNGLTQNGHLDRQTLGKLGVSSTMGSGSSNAPAASDTQATPATPAAPAAPPAKSANPAPGGSL